MNTRWEHKSFFVPDGNLNLGADGRTSSLDHQLDQLGREGWELVAVAAHARQSTDAGYQVFLKRPSTERGRARRLIS